MMDQTLFPVTVTPVTGANDYFRFGEEAICNGEKDKQAMAAATSDLASTTSNSTGGRRRRISLAQKFCIPKVRRVFIVNLKR